MKLFFSYARVDKPTANKLIELMQIHEIWYDQRLYSGDNWWTTIVDQIERAEGFIYLISPDSLKSEYCNKEFLLAANQNKRVSAAFWVLVLASCSALQVCALSSCAASPLSSL